MRDLLIPTIFPAFLPEVTVEFWFAKFHVDLIMGITHPPTEFFSRTNFWSILSNILLKVSSTPITRVYV